MTNIFEVIQHFIDTNNACLNDDWAFINAILGIKSPSSSYPCSIFPVTNKQFLTPLPLPYHDPNKDHPSKLHDPLIKIDPKKSLFPHHCMFSLAMAIALFLFLKIFMALMLSKHQFKL